MKSIVAYFCLNNNCGNWIIVIIHFPWLFPDFSDFPWLFPDHFSIPWLFQVFQKSGHPDLYMQKYLTRNAGMWVSQMVCNMAMVIVLLIINRKSLISCGMSIGSIDELRFLQYRTSYMPSCHVLTFASAKISCLAYGVVWHLLTS